MNSSNFNKIVSPLWDYSQDLDSLENQIKNTYTFWGNALVQRSSLKGKILDWVRKWTPNSLQSNENKVWKHIFRHALTLQDSSINDMPAKQQSILFGLQHKYAKKSKEPLFEKTKEKKAKPAIPLHWTQDPTVLQQLSLLRANLKADETLDIHVLETLFGSERSLYENPDLMNRVNTHLNQKLKKEKSPPSSAISHSLNEAIAIENQLQTLIAAGKNQDFKSATQHLKVFSQLTAKKIAELKPGEKQLVFGGTPKTKMVINQDNLNPAHGFVFQLFNNKSVDEKLDKKLDEVFEKVKGMSNTLIPEKVQESVQQIVSEGLVSVLFPNLKKSLISKDQNILKKALMFLPEVGRMGLEKSLQSFEKTLCDEILLGLHPENREKSDEIRQAILEKSVQENLKEKFKASILDSIAQIHENFLESLTGFSSSLPPLAKELLSEFDYVDFGHYEAPMAFEITPQADGKFTLLVYATGSTAALQRAVPLKYQNLSSEQLNEDFFLRFYSYRAWPAWDSSHCYGPQDILDGLLANLNEEPTFVEGSLENLAADLSSMESPWGLLKGYISSKLDFKTAKERELYFFQWKKNALINLWNQLKPDNLNERKALCSLANNLLGEAAKFFEAELIEIGELKAIYATVWEIEENVKASESAPVVSLPKPYVVPRQFAEHVSFLFSSMNHSNSQLIKRCLIDVLGSEFETSLNGILKELVLDGDLLSTPPPLSSTPTLPLKVRILNFGKRSFNTLCSATVGITLQDLRAPTFFSFVRIAILVARVALSIFFPAFSITFNISWMVTFLAYEAIKETARALFPKQVEQFNAWSERVFEINRRLREWKIRLFVNATARFLLNKEQIDAFNAIVAGWQSTLTHSGKLSFSLEALPKGEKENSLHLRKVTKIVKRNSLQAPVQEASLEPFNPVPFTAENILENLDVHLNEIAGLKSGSAKVQRCKALMLALPMPLSGNQEDIWNQVGNYTDVLEKMSQLTLELYSNDLYGMPQEVINQVVVSLYKGYAIIDKLAHRCPEAGLEGYLPNPWALALLKDNIEFKIMAPEVQKQLTEVCDYFGIDRNKKYTREEIHEEGSKALFFKSNRPSSLDAGLYAQVANLTARVDYKLGGTDFEQRPISLAEERYFLDLLKSPDIEQKLQNAGLHENAPPVEKLAKLFSAETSSDLVPRSFQLLRFANLMVNEFVINISNPSMKALKIKDFSQFPVACNEKDNGFLKGFSSLPLVGHYLKKENRNEKLNQCFSINTIDIKVEGRENAVDDKGTLLPLLNKAASLPFNGTFGDIITNYLHTPARSQNTINNEISLFTERRGVADKDKILMSNELTLLNPQDRAAIEMLWADDEDQSVRVLSYFRQQRHLLTKNSFLSLFELLLLQGNALEKQLKSDPNFVQTLGTFFNDTLKVCGPGKIDKTVFMRIAQFALVQARSIDPNADKFFPDFSAEVLKDIERDVESVLDLNTSAENFALAYYFIDPTTASLETKIKATRDCLNYRFFFRKFFKNNNNQTFSTLAQDIWEGTITDILNQNKQVRDEILSTLAWRKGFLPSQKIVSWEGVYPHFNCGSVKVQISSEAIVFQEKLEENIDEELKNGLKLIFGNEKVPALTKTDKGYKVGDFTIIIQPNAAGEVKLKYMRGNSVWVELEEEKNPGKECKTYWLDKKNGIVTVLENGKQTQTFSAEKLDNKKYRLIVEKNENLQKIDLIKEKHQLALLDWFQPLESIEIFRDTHSEGVKRVNFTQLDLSFEVENCNGTLQATSEKIPGFHISEEQKQEKIPALGHHTRYLLLENTQNQHKVILPTVNLGSDFANFLLKKVANVETSHLIDLHLSKFMSQLALTDGIPPYFTYTIDSNGRLTSEEPLALLYLLMHAITQNNMDEIHYYLTRFENIGKRSPYPKELFGFVEILGFLGVAIHDLSFQRILLRLTAICEENRLIQFNDESNEENSSIEFSFFSWVTLQKNYLDYLKNKESSPYFLLNEYQELFLLHTIASKSKKVITSRIPKGTEARRLVETIGENTLMETLMDPRLSKRYSFLKQKYAAEGELPDAGFKDILKDILQRGLASNLDDKELNNEDGHLGTAQTSASKMLISLLKSKKPVSSAGMATYVPGNVDPYYIEMLEWTVGEVPSHITEEDKKEDFKLKCEEFKKMKKDLSAKFPSLLLASNPKLKHFFKAEELRALHDKYLLIAKGDNPYSRENQSNMHKLNSVFNRLNNNFYYEALAEWLKIGWEELPIHFTDFSTDQLNEHFYIYYQLAIGKPPLHLEGDAKKQFLDKSSDFKKNLRVAKGKNAEGCNLLEILQLASQGNSIVSFPDPQTFEINLKQHFVFQKETLEALQNYRDKKISALTANIIQNKYNLNQEKIRNFKKEILEASSKALTFSPTNRDKITSLLKQQAPTVALVAGVNYLPSLLGMMVPFPIVAGIQGGLLAYKGLKAYESYKQFFDQIESEKKAAKIERMEMESAQQKIEELLSKESVAQINAEDAQFADFCQGLLNDHFSVPDPAAQLITAVEPFECPSDTPMMQKVFSRLNQSLKDFYARPKVKNLPTEFKGIEHYYKLNSELNHAKKRLEIIVETEKKKLLQPKVKPKVETRTDQEVILDNLKSKKHLHKTDTSFSTNTQFDLLIKAFIANDEKELLRLSGRDKLALPKLKLSLYKHLVKATRLQQIERALQIQEKIDPAKLSDDEMQIRLKQLTFELGRERAYAFDGIPTRLMRGYMAFEYGSRTLLWDRQVNQLQKMLLDDHDRIVLELITGSGKTFFGTPMISFFGSDGKQAIYNCFPESLAPENIKDLSGRSHTVFGQTTNAVKVTRETTMNADKLWALLRVHMRSLDLKEHLNGCKNDLLALELLFIEAAHGGLNNCTPEKEAALLPFMRLLHFIRTKERANVDEAHKLFRYNDELNHPLGEKQVVKKAYVNVISECMRLLIAVPEIAAAIQLDKNDQTLCDSKTYHQKIKPLLAAQLAKFRAFSILPSDQEEFAAYLCGNVEEVPEFVLNHPLKDEIGLAVGVLNKIMPDALEKKVKVHFGTEGNPHGFAQPYKAKDSPLEGSTFKNPFEAVLKTFMASLYNPLSSEQTKSLQKKMEMLATEEAKKRNITLEETHSYKLFLKWTGGKCSLFDKQTDLNELERLLNQGYGPKMTYARLFAVPYIEYFTENISGNSQNFASMFNGFYAGTASPNNDETFPTNTKVQWDEGTEGKFVDFLTKNVRDEDIFGLDNRVPGDVLNELLTTLFGKNSSKKALIDSGALLFGLSNENVAEKILEHLSTLGSEIQAVVFYNSKDELVIKEKGKAAVPLASSAIPPEKRLTYYDQSHTFGADIVQAIGAEGVVTVSENSDFDFEKLFQAGGRMRGLDAAKQRISIAIHKSLKDKIVSKKHEAIRDVIAHTKVAEAKGIGESSWPSIQQQMANICRRAALDKMISAPDVKTMLKYFRELIDLLITKTDVSPFELYGYPEIEVPKEKALAILREQHYAAIHRSVIFLGEEKKSIKNQLETIGVNNTLPPVVKLYKRNGRYHLKSNDLGMAQNVSAQQNANQAVEQDQQQEQNIDNEQNQNQNLQLEMDTIFAKRPFMEQLRVEPAQWEDQMDYFASMEWWKVSKEVDVNHHKAAEVYSVDASLANSSLKLFSDVNKAFEGNLFWSNNLRGVLNNGQLAPCNSPLQKPIMELLIIQDTSKGPDAPIMTCAIDQADASFWRKKMAADRASGREAGPIKIGLFDLTLNTVVSNGKSHFDVQKLADNATFQFDCARWRFLAGRVELQADPELKHNEQQPNSKKGIGTVFYEWLVGHDFDKMKDLYTLIYKVHGISPFEGSQMQSIFGVDERLLFEDIL